MKKINFSRIMKSFIVIVFCFLVSTISYAQVGIGITSPLNAQLTVNEDAIFNESGGANDFRIESNNRTNMFFVDASANRIGINTNLPTYQFDIHNSGNIGANTLFRSYNTGIDGVTIFGQNTSTTNGFNAIEGSTNYNGTAGIVSGVYGLAINNTNASRAIGVRGDTNNRDGVGVRGSRNGNSGAFGWGGAFYNDLGLTGFFGIISDKKTKTNITPISDALNIINQLNPVTYNYDLIKYPNMGLNTEMEYGFIAQEVREILPEVTREKFFDTNATTIKKLKSNEKDSSEKFIVLDYLRIIPILTKATKEQQTIIETQNARISNLESKISLLENKLNDLLKKLYLD